METGEGVRERKGRSCGQALGVEDLDLVSVFGGVDADEVASVYEVALGL